MVHDYAIRAQELGLSLEIAQALTGESGLRFISAAETAPPVSGEVDAVGFPFDLADMSIPAHYLVADATATGGNGGYRLDTNGAWLSPLRAMSSAMRLSSTSPPVGTVVYSRTMGGSILLGLPGGEVAFEPLYGQRWSLGWLEGSEILAATLTRPHTPYDYYGGNWIPAYLWTVERQGTSGPILVVRALSYEGVQTAPLLSVAISEMDHYDLATAWDRLDEALLTISANSGEWAVFDVKYFYDEVPMEERFRFDLLANTSMFPGAHLFRGVFAEDGGIVIPLTKVTPSAEIAGLPSGRAVERRGMYEPKLADDVVPSSLDAHAW